MTTPITLVGNIVNDPELRYTSGGHAVTSFTVAVNERVKGADGEWTDGDTTYYDCSAWRTLAEHTAESFTKGTRVIVTGGLKARRWEGKDGKTGTSLDVTVEACGPELRFATATTQRVGRDRTGTGYQPSAPQAAAPAPQPTPVAAANDPWAVGATGEPPF